MASGARRAHTDPVGPIHRAASSAGLRLAVLAACVLLFPLGGGLRGNLLAPQFRPSWPAFVSHPFDAPAPSSDTPKNRANIREVRDGAVAVGTLGGLLLVVTLRRRATPTKAER
jgi:hypothetical protein